MIQSELQNQTCSSVSPGRPAASAAAGSERRAGMASVRPETETPCPTAAAAAGSEEASEPAESEPGPAAAAPSAGWTGPEPGPEPGLGLELGLEPGPERAAGAA